MDFGRMNVTNITIAIFLKGVNFGRILCSCVSLGWEGWKMLKKRSNSRLIKLFIINIDLCSFGASRGGPLPPKKFGNPGERLRKRKWDLNELPKFEKNFYVEHPEVARLTPVSH